MSEFKSYPQGTRVRIKSTGEEGEAYESYMFLISIFVDGRDKCEYFNIDEVEFLSED